MLGCDSNCVGSINGVVTVSRIALNVVINSTSAWIPAYAGTTEGVIDAYPNFESFL
jgi:hypothetical protein